VIYLDQCHVSRMAKARLGRTSDPDELALLTRLQGLVQAGLAVVPFSMWHVMETVAYDDTDARDEICRVLGGLSQGQCLRFCHDIIDDEVLFAAAQTTVGAHPAAPRHLGQGLDCFPISSIHELTNAYVLATHPSERFQEIVDLSRRTNMRELHDRFETTLWGAERTAAASRARKPLKLDAARKAEAADVLGSTLVRRSIDAAATTLSIRRETVNELIVRGSFRRVPGLAGMIEIRARRDVQYTMAPTANDVTDAGHLLALPHVKWFLTDRKAAAIARDAGKCLARSSSSIPPSSRPNLVLSDTRRPLARGAVPADRLH
jgi:hypothetical protein